MTDFLIFGGVILAVVGIILVVRIGPKQLPAWAATKAGRGALSSMALGLAVIVVVGLLLTLPGKANAQERSLLDTSYGRFLNRAYVFAGVDFTRKASPQCVAGSTDDRLTSNMGFGLNVWESNSKRVALDLQYTHHSCVLGVDRNSYDGLGLRVTWVPWQR